MPQRVFNLAKNTNIKAESFLRVAVKAQTEVRYNDLHLQDRMVVLLFQRSRARWSLVKWLPSYVVLFWTSRTSSLCSELAWHTHCLAPNMLISHIGSIWLVKGRFRVLSRQGTFHHWARTGAKIEMEGFSQWWQGAISSRCVSLLSASSTHAPPHCYGLLLWAWPWADERRARVTLIIGFGSLSVCICMKMEIKGVLEFPRDETWSHLALYSHLT